MVLRHLDEAGTTGRWERSRETEDDDEAERETLGTPTGR
jgi:hypothetical protein